jgi:hypothetical protein
MVVFNYGNILCVYVCETQSAFTLCAAKKNGRQVTKIVRLRPGNNPFMILKI